MVGLAVGGHEIYAGESRSGFLDKPQCLTEISGKDRRCQTVLGIVRYAYRIFKVTGTNAAENRIEDLLPGNPHIRLQLVKDGYRHSRLAIFTTVSRISVSSMMAACSKTRDTDVGTSRDARVPGGASSQLKNRSVISAVSRFPTP